MAVVAALLATGWSPAGLAHAARGPARPVLVFSLDQGVPDGPVQNRDMEALRRVVRSLAPFRAQRPVFGLLAAAYADKSKLESALNLFQQEGLPFVLDVYSSDVMMAPAGNQPFDAAHGQALSMPQLEALRRRYGRLFAGVRIFETMAQSYGVAAARQGGARYIGADWISRVKGRMPADDFFEPAIAEGYFRFAARHGMFVIVSDWYWPNDPANAGDAEALRQPQNLEAIARLLRRYLGVGYVVYDNNQPNGQAMEPSDAWVGLVAPLARNGARGIGLSDQAWMCTGSATAESTCPADRLIAWARNAVANHAALIETEPYWYWWNFPRGTPTRQGYAAPAGGPPFGTPRPALGALARALQVPWPAP